jgi:hypothetical protein
MSLEGCEHLQAAVFAVGRLQTVPETLGERPKILLE